MQTLAVYLYAAMVAWSPLSHHTFYEKEPVTALRYMSLAASVASEVTDPDEDPLFEDDPWRVKSALLILSVGSFESGGFNADVQYCKRGGDGATSWGLFQSKAGKAVVCSSVRAAVRMAMKQVRASLHDCREEKAQNRLAEYASGSCAYGQKESRDRMRRAEVWWREHPFSGAFDPS